MREKRARIAYHGDMPALPVHPYRKIAERQTRVGAVAIGAAACLGLLAAGTGMLAIVPLAGLIGLAGASLVYLSSYSKSQCDAVLARGIAVDLAGRGELDAAEAILADVRVQENGAWRMITVQRAQLALERAEPDAADAHATAALTRPIGGLVRDVQRMQNAHAHALRAVARAALGKDTDALADVAVVRASDASMPEVLALAAVAEQVVLSRRGDLVALGASLAAARPLFEMTPSRERALVRAFRRLVAAKQTSAYREPGRVDDAPRSQPAPDGWAARIAPEARAFLPETERRERTAVPDVTQPTSTPVAAGSSAIAREGSRTPSNAGRGPLFAICAALAIFGFVLVVWQLLSRTPTSPDASTAVVCILGGAVVLGLFFARIARVVARDATARGAVLHARRVLATGDEASAERLFAALARSSLPATAAEAQLELALIAEHRADLRATLEHCDAALATLARSPGGGAGHTDLLLPRLVAERAFALAALGRSQQADAELAALATTYPTYAHLTAAIFRTRLLSALRGLSTAAATELARERTPQLALSVHDEAMADAVLALESGNPRELARLHEELADPALARWLDYMVPGAREQIATRVSA